MNENPYQAPSADLILVPAQEDELASRPARLAATVIDTIILLVLQLPPMWLTGYFDRVLDQTMAFGEMVAWTAGGIVVWLVVNGFTLHTRGQSLGKMAMGIQIVSADSRELHSLSRITLLRVLPVTILSVIPFIGSLLALVDALMIFRGDRRCAHDLIAGTRVVTYRAMPARENGE